MFLLKIRVPQTCFEIALHGLQAKVGLGYTKDSSGTTYRISLTISTWKNG